MRARASAATDAEREFRRRFGLAVRAHRLRLGLTQGALAARTGLSQKFISRVEGGGVGTSAWVAWRLAAALDVGAGELVGGGGAALVGGRERLPGDVARFLYLMHRAAPEERRRIYAVVRALVRTPAGARGGASGEASGTGEPAARAFKVPRPRRPR